MQDSISEDIESILTIYENILDDLVAGGVISSLQIKREYNKLARIRKTYGNN